MPSYLIEEIVIFLVVGAIVVAAIWQIGTSLRAKAARNQDTEYKKIAERAVTAQEATETRLTHVTNQLAGMDERVATVERILKDAE